MRSIPAVRLFLAVLVALILPAVAGAQSVAGTVRDSSGGPPRRVRRGRQRRADREAGRSSPTPTGSIRSSTCARAPTSSPSRCQGSRPSRAGVEVSGGGVTTINAEMRVGGVQETITVTGESPVVDVQTSTSREQVLSNEFVRALPASRGYGNYLAGVPGISGTGSLGRRHLEQLLHLARRPQQRGQHPDRRHERRLVGRRRGRFGLSVRHVQCVGSAGHDRRRPGRSRPRRAGVQHGSEDRRQQVQRDLFRQSRRRVGAGQQHRR